MSSPSIHASPPADSDADDSAERYQRAYASALRLLARREHSELELRHKLTARSVDAALVEQVLAELLDGHLLSDARFTEVYVRGRFERGYGPARIRAELRERGIGDELAQPALEALADDWIASAVRQHSKRFGGGCPDDYRERARQMRFLQQRGFSGEQIRAVLATVGDR